jgi:hypothetical protein
VQTWAIPDPINPAPTTITVVIYSPPAFLKLHIFIHVVMKWGINVKTGAFVLTSKGDFDQ